MFKIYSGVSKYGNVLVDIYDNFLAVKEKDKETLNVCDVAHCAFNETSNSLDNIRKNIPRLTIDYLRSPDFTLSKNWLQEYQGGLGNGLKFFIVPPLNINKKMKPIKIA